MTCALAHGAFRSDFGAGFSRSIGARLAMFMCFAEGQFADRASAVEIDFPQHRPPAKRRSGTLPRLSDFPIPKGVQSDPSTWTEQMLEMSDHIGAYRTLLIVDRFAGKKLYIPADPLTGKSYKGVGTLRDLIGLDAAATLSWVFQREYLAIPAARHALAQARRAGLIAAVRAGYVSVTEAAVVAGTTRPYFSHLVNQTSEGVGVEPTALPMPREEALLLNVVRVIRDALAEVGIGPIASLSDRVLQLGAWGSDALRDAIPEISNPHHHGGDNAER